MMRVLIMKSILDEGFDHEEDSDEMLFFFLKMAVTLSLASAVSLLLVLSFSEPNSYVAPGMM